MGFDGQAPGRKGARGGVESRRPRPTCRTIAAAGIAVALLTPLAMALSPGGAAAASSNANPNGVLKYGFDLNNEFSNDFAPATEENDCSYTVTSNIYQSMTTPGNTARSAAEWPRAGRSPTTAPPSPFTSDPGLEFSNGQPVTSADVAASLNHTKTSPLRSSLFAISSIETPDPSTVVVNLSKPTAGDFLWAIDLHRRPDLPGQRDLDPIEPAGGRRSLPPEELPAGLVDRAHQEPQVLGLEGLSAGRRRLHPGDAGSRGGHRPDLGRGRHDRRSSRRTTRSSRATRTSGSRSPSPTTTWTSSCARTLGPSPTSRCGRRSSTP